MATAVSALAAEKKRNIKKGIKSPVAVKTTTPSLPSPPSFTIDYDACVITAVVLKKDE